MNLGVNLSQIKGVGPRTAQTLSAAGLSTVGDLINFLPRTYEDFSIVTSIAKLHPGKVTIKACCEQISTRIVRRAMRVTTAVLADDTGKVQAVWFNQPYRETQLKSGAEHFFSGEFGFRAGRYQLTTPSAEAVKDLPVQTGRILPIYPVRKGLKPNITRKILNELRPMITMLPEILPSEIVVNQKLLPRADALLGLHFPESKEQADAARERLAFEELFELLLASRLNKQENSKLQGFQISFNQPKIKKFVDQLPFRLTNSQRRALWDILCDFERKTPMNRMLQGDVGSGKTVVAGAAAYQASLAGFQAAIMAPTEILAVQHAETLDKLLSPFGVKVALLTSSVKGKVREELYKAITSGAVDIVVGTHALFQKDIKFHKLGFVVIDEQHRFGVEQRQLLLAKGNHMPHLLSMTATPIPRSLQLTLFGDLDISTLNELPAGRKKTETKIWSPNSRVQLYERIREQLTQGRQAYVVTPLIEETIARPGLTKDGEKIAAETKFKEISKKFKDFKVGLLHGKMPGAEKEKIMRDFASHKIDILVATTVIEVGVDVPNATVMLIENADHFGLAQLHQLRGRVGRGEHQSFCYLMMSDSSRPTRRLREIEKSNDGFYLSEVDLELRGPGQVYGTMQHGDLDLQIASLADTRLIARAAKSADWFIEHENLMKFPELKKNVLKYQRLTTLN
ncbi:MAG: ATP-dependent DNA helicase RecG [Candidatus Nomurabacteria bacterium]|jgi:ATP-dependent DNA helicase RecG|nr:ATP-dependent DNA helicase RecG [Candidatus Nomurabacteria bacterium]